MTRMADQSGVRRITLSSPAAVEPDTRFACPVQGRGKQNGPGPGAGAPPQSALAQSAPPQSVPPQRVGASTGADGRAIPQPPVRMVAVDLDGTLLRSDSTVSPRTVAALHRAVRAGARIVLVTARPPRYIWAVAEKAGLDGLAVCSNGAIVCDLDHGTTTIVGPLPMPVARRTAEVIGDALPGVGFAIETGERALIGPGYGHVPARDEMRVTVRTLDELWAATETCVKLLAWTPTPVTGPLLRRMQGLLPDVTVTYSGGRGMLEISARGVSKVDTITRLCAGWGVDRAAVVAFGDMPNDLSLLRWAGTSVAMSNAHPDVLAAADRITASNDDDGVALVLAEIFADPAGVVPTG